MPKKMKRGFRVTGSTNYCWIDDHGNCTWPADYTPTKHELYLVDIYRGMVKEYKRQLEEAKEKAWKYEQLG